MKGEEYKRREKVKRLRETCMLLIMLLAGFYYLFFGREQEAVDLYSRTIPIQESARVDAVSEPQTVLEGSLAAGGGAGSRNLSEDLPDNLSESAISRQGAAEGGSAPAGEDEGAQELASENTSVSTEGNVPVEGNAPAGGGALAGGNPSMEDASQRGNVENPSDPRVNINTAGMEELETLPGIGPATAQLIIEYRENYGGFADIAEIQNVKRIGEKTYAKIKDLIRV